MKVKIIAQKIDGEYTEEYLEQQKQIAIEQATLAYLLENLSYILLDGKPFVEWLYPDMNYFLIYNRNHNVTIPLTAEAQGIYEKLVLEKKHDFNPSLSYAFLQMYQNKTTEELKKEYQQFNGPEYITTIQSGEVVIVPKLADAKFHINSTVNTDSLNSDLRGSWGTEITDDSLIDKQSDNAKTVLGISNSQLMQNSNNSSVKVNV